MPRTILLACDTVSGVVFASVYFTKYPKLMNDPLLKKLWVPAMSKELHRLAQGKEGVTSGTNTIFFLLHDEIRCIPKDRVITYARIVIDHRPQKDNPNRVRITVGGNLIDYCWRKTLGWPM